MCGGLLGYTIEADLPGLGHCVYPSRTLGIVYTKRRSRTDRGAAHGSRLDRKVTVYQFHPLLHACETKPLAFFFGFGVEARTGIADCQMNLIGRSPEMHFDVAHSAVFRRIA